MSDQPGGRADVVVRVLSYVVLVVLTAQLTVVGAVLLYWRPGGVPAPVGLLLTLLVGPACWRGASLAGRRLGAAGPGLAWMVLVLQLTFQRREGDLFVDSGLRGLAFLLLGTISAAAAIGSWSPGASLARSTRRSSPRGGVPAR